MAKLKYIACFVMVSAVLYRPATAQVSQIKLGNLYEFCTSSDEAVQSACRFYILGVFEGAQIGGNTVQDKTGDFQEAKDKRFCVPPGLSASAMALTVKMAMGSDLAVFPQDRDLPAVSFITAVIAKQFPCHKQK
jgi:hypothetical protein